MNASSRYITMVRDYAAAAKRKRTSFVEAIQAQTVWYFKKLMADPIASGDAVRLQTAIAAFLTLECAPDMPDFPQTYEGAREWVAARWQEAATPINIEG